MDSAALEPHDPDDGAGIADPDPTPLVLDRRWYSSLDGPSRAALLHWFDRHQLIPARAGADETRSTWAVVVGITVHPTHVMIEARPAGAHGAGSTEQRRIDEIEPLRKLLDGKPLPPDLEAIALATARIHELKTALEFAAEHVDEDCPHYDQIQTALAGDLRP